MQGKVVSPLNHREGSVLCVSLLRGAYPSAASGLTLLMECQVFNLIGQRFKFFLFALGLWFRLGLMFGFFFYKHLFAFLIVNVTCLLQLTTSLL